MVVTLQIRKAEKTDIERLADIAFRAWEHSILPLLGATPEMVRREKQRLHNIAAETSERIIVAELDGRAIGWCSRARNRAYVPFLFVAPEYQGHGVGTALLRRIESMLELGGATRVHLETPADNVRAVRFYEKQGYHILAMRTDGRTNEDALTSIHLEKTLHPFKGHVTDD
ncbi:MAG: GCN5-related N-acetyltransferase [Devosia sp.]|nr:GCN5-related N-acetyltransferase [Devosia sp.]